MTSLPSPKRRGRGSASGLFLVLNVTGGCAVLGSYAYGLWAQPDASAVWGGVPEALRPLYTAGMILAALGYFLFSAYVYFGLDTEEVVVFGRFGFGLFNVLYAAILVPSALWMPLTVQMLAAPSVVLWVSIRLVLLIVGVSSVVLIGAIRSAAPAGGAVTRALALGGALAFAFQTLALDAIVWPAFFPQS